VSLQGIIRRSRNYTMSRVNTPLALTRNRRSWSFPDWIIAAKRAVAGVLYRQGLFLLGDGERPLPTGAGTVLEKNGLAVTEIVGSAQWISQGCFSHNLRYGKAIFLQDGTAPCREGAFAVAEEERALGGRAPGDGPFAAMIQSKDQDLRFRRQGQRRVDA